MSLSNVFYDNAVCDSTYTLRIKYTEKGDSIAFGADDLHISYFGSTLRHRRDFIATTEIKNIDGSGSASFTIKILPTMNGTININVYGEGVIVEHPNSKITVTCSSSTSSSSSSTNTGSSCSDKGFFFAPYGHSTKLPSYMKGIK